MGRSKLTMRKIKEILRLRLSEKRSLRDVAKSVNVSSSVVHGCEVRFKASGLSWPECAEMEDSSLESKLYELQAGPRRNKAQPDFENIHLELRRKGVTLYLLWQEYKKAHPEEGYQYSRFCELYRRWQRPLDAVMRQEHRAGEKAFVDWSGDGVPIIKLETGEVKEAALFVGILGASGYTFAKTALSRELQYWIQMHMDMYAYFQGVPSVTVPDNEKTGVRSPCHYEPDLNPTYQDLAEHYQTSVIPARPKKPRDKAKVENAVLNVQRWVLGKLRNHRFFKVEQANEAISRLMVEYNDEKYKKLKVSRRELFETLDRPALKPLPAMHFEYGEWSEPKVNIDYHVVVDKHIYSAPYKLIGERVKARRTATTVELFHNGRRVAIHERSYKQWGTTTNPDHMPPSHRIYSEWTPSRIIEWAGKAGPKVAELVEKILEDRCQAERGYRSCLGVMRLAKIYEPNRMEAACARAIALGSASYKTVKFILKNGQDRLPLPQQTKQMALLPKHENIRGPEYYN